MRINVYERETDPSTSTEHFYDPDPEPAFLGWFDWHKAQRWTDRDHNNNGSGGVGRGQSVLRTAGGKWVLEHWTIWQDEESTYHYISDDEARDWLLAHDLDAVVGVHWGPVAEEEDRRPGRPEIGGNVHVRLGDDLLARVNRWAEGQGLGQAEAIRLLVKAGFERFGL